MVVCLVPDEKFFCDLSVLNSLIMPHRAQSNARRHSEKLRQAPERSLFKRAQNKENEKKTSGSRKGRNLL